MSRTDRQREALARFKEDTANHKMTILRDDGLYRHLRFQRPGTWSYGFDIVTWPGFLAITGDMGDALFARMADMIEFFRADQRWQAEHPGELYINQSYWAEKCRAHDGRIKEFCEDSFRQVVKERFDAYINDHSTDDNDGKPVPPKWAPQLWEEIETGLFDRDRGGTDFALAALHDFEPIDRRYDNFGFTDVGDYASQIEEYTFHYTWRLYAIAYAVMTYDAEKAKESVPE